jgi:hypothetical protein
MKFLLPITLILPSSGLLRDVRWFWSRRFEIIYRSHLQEWKVYRPLEMGPIISPETSVSNHLVPQNNPEARRIHLTAAESYDDSLPSLQEFPTGQRLMSCNPASIHAYFIRFVLLLSLHDLTFIKVELYLHFHTSSVCIAVSLPTKDVFSHFDTSLFTLPATLVSAKWALAFRFPDWYLYASLIPVHATFLANLILFNSVNIGVTLWEQSWKS